MNLLIIDDDKTTVDALLQRIDWRGLGFETTFAAYSADRAKEIIDTNDVHLMLCDIEMPRENGLSLLAWARAQGHPMECIFLTNHLEFGYAQQAIKLGSFDYLSKTCSNSEIEIAVKKAMKKINDAMNFDRYMNNDLFYNVLSQRFMEDMIQGRIPENAGLITRIVHENCFPFPPEMTLIPILMVISRYGPDIKSLKFAELDFIVGNVLNELLVHEKNYNIISQMDDNNYYYIVVFHMQPETPNEGAATARQRAANEDAVAHRLAAIEDASRQAFDFFSGSLGVPPTLYLYNKAVHLWELHSWYTDALRVDHANTGFRERILHSGDFNLSENSNFLKLEIQENWELLLRQSQTTQLLREVRAYLTRTTMGHSVPPQTLNLFYHDFMQLINAVLKEKGIPSHMIFEDSHLAALAKYAAHSLIDLVKWISTVLPMAAEQMEKAATADNPEQQMLDFIHQNFQNKISRNDIAKVIHLSPEYAARLFKAKSGVSLNSYLNRYRVEKAKELMQNKNLSISDISDMVGFEQFSYFSSTFHAIEGMSPREYRKNQRL